MYCRLFPNPSRRSGVAIAGDPEVRANKTARVRAGGVCYYLSASERASYRRGCIRIHPDEAADDLFDVITSGAVKIAINQRFPLAEAREAHEALHSRATAGATILVP